jgi:hypothetical protein
MPATGGVIAVRGTEEIRRPRRPSPFLGQQTSLGRSLHLLMPHLVRLWFGSPHCELAAEMMRTSEPPILGKLAAHEDTRKGHTWLQSYIEWFDRLEAGGPIEPFSIQCRKAVKFAYAELEGFAEAMGKQGSPDSSSNPIRMNRHVTDMRLPFNDFAGSRPRRRPTATPDRGAGFSFRNVVGAGSEEGWIGAGHKRQSSAEHAAVITSGTQNRITCQEQSGDRIRVCGSGNP